MSDRMVEAAKTGSNRPRSTASSSMRLIKGHRRDPGHQDSTRRQNLASTPKHTKNSFNVSS